ncbi:MAG: 3-deoxy-7-phosphoheptulonate synthase [Burkholderiales bacterium]
MQQVQSLGLKPHVLRGTERTVIAAIGDERAAASVGVLESGPGVDEVLPVLAPYKLASVETKAEKTVVRAGSLAVGNGHLGIIAGPCSVESEEQILATARAVKAAGAHILRGGAFKPRTSPYDFQGLEREGLELLRKAKQATGLAIITEVMSDSDVDLIAEYADIIQVGARNMQNFALLKALGRVRKPVMLKRGLSSTLKELLLSAEYIVSKGNHDVMVCERGVRTFETYTRNTLDLSAVPALAELTHLPVIVDPSHGTGKRSLIPAMSRAAVAAGADGLMIEVHPRPEEAFSDGPQSLTLEMFGEIMADLQPYLQLWMKDRTREVVAATV